MSHAIKLFSQFSKFILKHFFFFYKNQLFIIIDTCI